jgi:hypothetical protein
MQLADFCRSLERVGKNGKAQICSDIAVRVHEEFTTVKAFMDCEIVLA